MKVVPLAMQEPWGGKEWRNDEQTQTTVLLLAIMVEAHSGCVRFELR